jgi:hypothetical protein
VEATIWPAAGMPTGLPQLGQAIRRLAIWSPARRRLPQPHTNLMVMVVKVEYERGARQVCFFPGLHKGGTPFGTPMGVAVACSNHALRITSERATLPQLPLLQQILLLNHRLLRGA